METEKDAEDQSAPNGNVGTSDSVDSFDGPTGEELFFALVYPVGTSSKSVVSTVQEALDDVNYTSDHVHLIKELQDTAYGKSELIKIRDLHTKEHPKETWPPYFRTYMEMMDLGNALRRDAGKDDDTGLDAMALFAATRVLSRREPAGQAESDSRSSNVVRQRHAYIIQSLKVPEEIHRLRNIYGDALVVVAVHSDEEERHKNLTWRIKQSAKTVATVEDFRSYAEILIARDYREAKLEGQQLTGVFPLADVFVDSTHPRHLKSSIQRYVEILFRHRLHTPTKDEYGMFHAFGASLRSADLSRQVGAAIVDEDGELIALGTNEVPKAGGGQYWPDDTKREDGRDFTFGRDISTEIKKSAIDQLLAALEDSGHLKDHVESEAIWQRLRGTDFMNVGEFGRGTHAEMGAIVHAARRGRSLENSTLYTTTFPCHVCARHIVQSGISRVVFNEPYPKSLVWYLHRDSIVVGGQPRKERVLFEPFVGIAPALYGELFRVPRGSRMTGDGRIPVWQRREARPSRVADPNSYLEKEIGGSKRLLDWLKERGRPL